MRPKTKPPREGTKNVTNFPRKRKLSSATAPPEISQDQAHLRKKIRDSLNLGENSPVAAAAVFLRADGTIETTAIGIEPAVCARFAAELDRLSRLTRWHAQRRRAPAQSGWASLAVLLPGILMAASYINTLPWLDSLICLGSHAIAYWMSDAARPDH